MLRNATSAQVGATINLLCATRILSKVKHSAGNGIPLGAESNEKLNKYLFLDVGLQLSLCDLDPTILEQAEDLMFVNQGSLAEQFVGQHLLYSRPPYIEPELYFWKRTKLSSEAEVDYLISFGGTVIPCEVKAGATGRLKSLHVFLQEKGAKKAVRFSTMAPSVAQIGEAQIVSLPLYLVDQLQRILS